MRREALKTALLLGGLTAAGSAGVGVAAGAASGRRADSASAARGPSLRARDDAPIVETRAGKVIGYVRNDILTFKGIPYADTTEGVNRFVAPQPAKPWTGVRSSRQYGHVAPQGPRSGWANDEEAFMFAWDDGIQGEDCLRVNVWTPGRSGKRPVMVWLHGGGFAAGSGQELQSYDGENLARRGDVVVVSLNHRLNVLGYLDLSSFGARYRSSVNAGMLDIVAALEWIRDNIAAFGGDPGCVTVFGQSGGGAKVAVLMAMPAARGLFHRAIVESGSLLRAGSPERSERLAAAVVSELGLSAATIDRIHTLPYETLRLAAARALDAQGPKREAVPNFRRLAEIMGFVPAIDERSLPAHPFDPKASDLSADVPMIIGSTLNEFTTAINHPEYEAMTSSELEDKVREAYGEHADAVIQAFRRRIPDARPFDLWSRIASASVREAALAQAAAKAGLGRAPAYLYWFTWQTPVLDGRPRAFHCAEIPFVFDNTDRCETMTGGGPDARALAARMSDAWIHFARSGDPNHPGLPKWRPYRPGASPTMIFDNRCACVDAPDAEEQAAIAATQHA